jgi:hypothetical protein
MPGERILLQHSLGLRGQELWLNLGDAA